jgi:hypothetical protein
MKTITRLALVATLGCASALTVAGQEQPARRAGRPGGHQPPAHTIGQGPQAETIVAHLTEAYTVVAPFDRNHDKQLDDSEQIALAKAVVEGAIQLPLHRLPPGAKPDAERLLRRTAALYAEVAPLDANADGQLDATEQAALKAAVEKGELHLPRHGRGPGGRPGRPSRE